MENKSLNKQLVLEVWNNVMFWSNKEIHELIKSPPKMQETYAFKINLIKTGEKGESRSQIPEIILKFSRTSCIVKKIFH